MKNKKVAILMSTYNGEQYIESQIDSLINQTYSNIEIYIRDDGSKDNTVNIIKKYQKDYKNINLIQGENLGFINSFFYLIDSCTNADYYAYCDQDDVWMENKIESAVQFLDKSNKNKPVLYFSNSDYYDENMNYIATAEKNKVYNFRNSLVECVTQGMTMVINEKTRSIISNNKPQHCLYHDWWTYMICSGFGEIIYDDKSLVKYRRHKKSVTVEGKGKIELFIWRVKKFLFGNSLDEIKQQLQEYQKFFYDKLCENDRKLLNLFTKENYSFIYSLKKAFYPKRFRRKISDEIMLRIMFIIGKL